MGRDGKILRDKIEYFFKVKRNDYSIFLSVCCKVIKDKHDKVHRPTYHQRDMCKPYIIEKLKLLTYYGDLTIITLGMDALISVTDYEGSLINCRNYYFTTEFNGRKITCLPTVLPYTSRSNDKVKGAMERDFKSFYGELYKFERKEVEFYLS
jgi:uracil-DNA glycosylase family 4